MPPQSCPSTQLDSQISWPTCVPLQRQAKSLFGRLGSCTTKTSSRRLPTRGMPWAKVEPSIYTQCFTGMAANPEGWCKRCQSIEHPSDRCPDAPPLDVVPLPGQSRGASVHKRPWQAQLQRGPLCQGHQIFVLNSMGTARSGSPVTSPTCAASARGSILSASVTGARRWTPVASQAWPLGLS